MRVRARKTNDFCIYLYRVISATYPVGPVGAKNDAANRSLCPIGVLSESCRSPVGTPGAPWRPLAHPWQGEQHGMPRSPHTPPAYAPCPACGQPILTGQTRTGDQACARRACPDLLCALDHRSGPPGAGAEPGLPRAPVPKRDAARQAGITRQTAGSPMGVREPAHHKEHGNAESRQSRPGRALGVRSPGRPTVTRPALGVQAHAPG